MAARVERLIKRSTNKRAAWKALVEHYKNIADEARTKPQAHHRGDCALWMRSMSQRPARQEGSKLYRDLSRRGTVMR
jgi:hypothetical protein